MVDIKHANYLLSQLYPKLIETGHQTAGHLCIKESDKKIADKKKASLLYGEIAPDGMRKLLDDNHACVKKATKVFDLGMGVAKVALQALLENPNLQEVVGVELSESRYKIAETAVIKLVDICPTYTIVQYIQDKMLKIKNKVTGCTLTISCDDLFNETRYTEAEIIIFDTDIPESEMARLGRHFSELKKGTKVISYNNFEKWDILFPYFRQMDVNKTDDDTFVTSWAYKNGHKFYVWEKVDMNINWEEYFADYLELIELEKKYKNKTTYYGWDGDYDHEFFRDDYHDNYHNKQNVPTTSGYWDDY